MTLERILKLALLAIVIYAGVQFSSAYVARTQIGHILESVAFEARRNQHSKSEIKQTIISRMDQSNTELPYEMQILINGLGDKREPLEIILEYTHIVELKFFEVELSMRSSGRSKPAM